MTLLINLSSVTTGTTERLDAQMDCTAGRRSIPGNGIGVLFGQIAGAPPACRDKGNQRARLTLVRSKNFREPSSIGRASGAERRKAGASVENRTFSKQGAWRLPGRTRGRRGARIKANARSGSAVRAVGGLSHDRSR
jgi:hypothetical protein